MKLPFCMVFPFFPPLDTSHPPSWRFFSDILLPKRIELGLHPLSISPILRVISKFSIPSFFFLEAFPPPFMPFQPR